MCSVPVVGNDIQYISVNGFRAGLPYIPLIWGSEVCLYEKNEALVADVMCSVYRQWEALIRVCNRLTTPISILASNLLTQ